MPFIPKTSLKFFLACILSVSVAAVFLNHAQAGSQPDLVIYTYDSFLSKSGLGSAIIPLFNEKYHCEVKALASGSGAQLLARMQLDAERKKPGAQMVIGLDQHLWERAKLYAEPWQNWRPQGYDRLVPEIILEDGFLPYDYGIFALMADMQTIQEKNLKAPKSLPMSLPKSLEDLHLPIWKKSLILEDPRTSTPGLAFLLFTHELYNKKNPNGFADFWKKLRPQWLTLAPSWSEAYGIFLKEEAPLVWSYTTSQAYHLENGDTSQRYQAVLFDEGQPLQIEGAVLVKGSFKNAEQKKLAQQFMDFLISPEVQAMIPGKNWMLPSLKSVVLPASFKSLPVPKKLYRLQGSTQQSPKQHQEILESWSRALHE